MKMNSAAPMNTAAASAVIAVFLLVAVLFGSPPGSAPAGAETGVVAVQDNEG